MTDEEDMKGSYISFDLEISEQVRITTAASLYCNVASQCTVQHVNPLIVTTVQMSK